MMMSCDLIGEKQSDGSVQVT